MSLKICCLGDVMAGENHYHYRRGIRTHYKNNYNDLIAGQVKNKLFKDSDILFYNFEYSLTDEKGLSRGIHSSIYRACEDSLNIFPDNLKKVVNIANNHFSQHGKESAQYTKQLLKEKGYTVVGETNIPAVIETKGQVLKIWGVSLIKDVFFCGEYFFSDYKNLISDLQLPNKEKNEKWIIAIHWGDEYITTPSARQIELGRKLAEAGFDLIAGHHPHVVQPVEKYKDSVIIYSMGNFIFDQNFSPVTQKGLAVVVDVNENVEITKQFYTLQKKYKVAGITEKKDPLFTGTVDQSYKRKLKINSLIIRLLMKAELIAHLPEVHKDTLRMLLGKAGKKLNSQKINSHAVKVDITA